jgi:YVTN family beta-propeller protein
MKISTAIIFFLFSVTVFAQRDAYVVNSLAETLTKIDLETGAVSNHVVTLGEVPNQVVYHDGYLYAVNSVSADIYKIDPVTYNIISTVFLPVGSNPYFATFDGDYGYVTCWVSGQVYKFDIYTSALVSDVNIGNYPEGIIFDNGLLYVTRTYFNPNNWTYGQGDIAVIDPADMSFLNSYNIGTNPQWIGRASDGNLHIVCTGNYVDIEGSVYIFNPSTNMVTDSILIGGQPANLAVAGDGIGYLSAGGWVNNGHLYSYNTATLEILNGPSNPILVGLGASSVAVDSDGFIYSANFGDDTVTKLNSSGQVSGNYNVGDGPVSVIIVEETVGIDDEPFVNLPEKIAVLSNYPNPFNGGTVISYETNAVFGDLSEIIIYDIFGRIIRKLKISPTDQSGTVYWDGFDSGLRQCPSGVYFAAPVKTNDNYETILTRGSLKMMLIK